MNFDSTQKELFNYISLHPIFRIFIPINEAILIGGQIIIILSNVWLHWNLITSILTILVYVAIVVELSKGNYKALLIGLLLRVVVYLIAIIRSLTGGYLMSNLSSILYLIIWAYFAYVSYKKINNIS